MDESTVIKPSDAKILRSIRDKFIPKSGQAYYVAAISQMADKIEALEKEVDALSLQLQNHQARGDYDVGYEFGCRSADLHHKVVIDLLVKSLESFLRCPSVGSDGPGSSTLRVMDFNLDDARSAIAKHKGKA